MKTGMPLTLKRVTVDGSAVQNPQNVIVPVGTKIAALMEFCGGYREEPKKIIMGGPMMGVAVTTDELPVLKSRTTAFWPSARAKRSLWSRRVHPLRPLRCGMSDAPAADKA